ncbi:MAG: Na+/H+ antiporter subunit E [Oleiphilaceae bacterium]|nr:Na+/H+ antiporter subunit E [Oleiphilaceae bacterium]
MLRKQPLRQIWPRPEFSALLLLLWLLLMNSFALGQVVLGLALAWLLPFVTQQFWPEKPQVHNANRLLVYLAHLLWDIIQANFTVARLLLKDPATLQPAFVRYPLMLTDEFAITLLASTITLTPGTVSAGLSPDRKTLLIHALHEPDPDAMVRQIHQRYELPLKEILE